MTMRLPLVVLYSALVVASVAKAAGDARFKLTLQVVDDEGRPVPEAQVRIAAGARPTEEKPAPIVFAEGMTDEHGIYSGEVRAWDASDAGYRVVKDGHYIVWLPYRATKTPFASRWEPWNPTIRVVLKRIRNPVPMYAKRQMGELPAKDQDVGYDLVAGDWVHPYGRGLSADIIFHGTLDWWNDDRNYSAKLIATFPGEGNGLISYMVDRPGDTVLRMPYEAPEDGYAAKRVWSARRRYDAKAKQSLEYVGKADPAENFFIRIRTEFDERGRVIKAMYGKIHAPFHFGPTRNGMPAIQLTYFLNPDGTRNIEFDPKRNLLKSSRRRDPNYENLGP